MSYQELEEARRRTKTNILAAEEAEILNKEYFENVKVKSDTGTVEINLHATGGWELDKQNRDEIYMPLYINLYSYRPNTTTMRLSKEL